MTTAFLSQVLDPSVMQSRKDAYFQLVQSHAFSSFTPEGEYQPQVEPDRRITYWIMPALLVADDPAVKALGLELYANDPCWDGWNIFTTSSIAVNLMRERAHLTPELIARSEDHLDRFSLVEGGRKPCSAANDYMFHGANDNMPAMATRTLIFAGELLDRRDLLDRGLFLLETLCANFQRRGMLSEYNSSTYTPITLVSLMDIAECAKTPEAVEMAEACANRVFLDIAAHWHQQIGTPSGSSSRCYLGDYTISLSTQNALMWYLGFPGVIDLIEAFDGTYDGPLHHGPDGTFSMAHYVECFAPDFSRLRPAVVDFARTERSYPYEVRATMDSMKTTNAQTRMWQQPNWSLGTSSTTMWKNQSGQHATLRGTLLRGDDASNYRNRVGIWHYLQSGSTDWGDIVGPPDNYGDAPVIHVNDYGEYHTLQDKGSAMVLGSLGSSLLDKEAENLKLVIIASIFGQLPDEMVVDTTPLTEWTGTAPSTSWHFLRFGTIFIGIRAAGMYQGTALSVERVIKDDYLRVEVSAFAETTTITQELREHLDVAYVLEMASAEECSFAQFCSECLASSWECYHSFYRHSRYQGRHGELQILDSSHPDSIRFMAVDGETEPTDFFSATGLDPQLLQLFADGRRVRQRSLVYDMDWVGSPFYDLREHILAKVIN